MTRQRHTHRVQLPDGPVEAEDHGYLSPDQETMNPDEIAATVADVTSSPEHQRRVAAAVEQAKRRPGRPSLDEEPAGRIGLRVTRRQRAALDQIADAEGRQVSSVVRDAVDEYLKRHAS